MEVTAHISFHSTFSDRRVLGMRILRYLQTGYLLHLMGLFSIFMAYFFAKRVIMLWTNDGAVWSIILHGYAGLYFFSLVFFSLLDARSRFQNYKMAKDRLFKYGFDARLLRPFMYSRCQRDAIFAAIKDLNMQKEWTELMSEMGFRWYHLLPHLVLRNPRILFTRDYWSKTLFVRTYRSKYFLW